MNKRKYAIIAGVSYIIIFFAAIFANFFVLEQIKADPMKAILEGHLVVRFGIIAFLITVVFDVVVAWALFEFFKGHVFIRLSTYFRLMHAAIMGVAIFALPLALLADSAEMVLMQVYIFNTIWLIGLFFFGFHLILLGNMLQKPRFIVLFLILAGIMYIVDTSAHFLMADYQMYANIFLAMVAVPSIFGEMAFSIWLLVKAGK
jgi:hypothetical protein